MRNRFKGLDLIDRVPDELWMEVRDIVQEIGIKTIPKKKKCKKAKWMSEETLQIVVKIREVKKPTRQFRYDLNQILYDYTVEVTNRIKRLDLIDRVPEELCTEVVTLYRRQ